MSTNESHSGQDPQPRTNNVETNERNDNIALENVTVSENPTRQAEDLGCIWRREIPRHDAKGNPVPSDSGSEYIESNSSAESGETDMDTWLETVGLSIWEEELRDMVAPHTKIIRREFAMAKRATLRSGRSMLRCLGTQQVVEIYIKDLDKYRNDIESEYQQKKDQGAKSSDSKIKKVADVRQAWLGTNGLNPELKAAALAHVEKVALKMMSERLAKIKSKKEKGPLLKGEYRCECGAVSLHDEPEDLACDEKPKGGAGRLAVEGIVEEESQFHSAIQKKHI
ncbi:hypothetical protein G7Y89_g6448 [Cudoniella acicularis]|uniref:Uncharacterized protein n=1 Tax=Cudoniella acicularis TaxID=354080 RepID=A0A8H4RKF6_9HELO|nr:hypothetical protein G7Y89_g6448 [Cudoniella acicularis]